MAAKSKPNEISITRVYNAPVEVVWDAWTDPKKAAKWWGPRGFTITTHSKDLKPGGIWHYTMHGPDGTDYPNKTLYHVVEKHKTLVYDHGGYDERKPLFRVTVHFSESAGQTTMQMTMALPTAEEAAKTRKFIKLAGGNATWDRLAEFLDEGQRGKHTFVINRTFAAPVEQVFAAWAEPDQLAKWLPPSGFTMDILRGYIKPGGTCFFRMQNGAGVTFHGRVEYLEIVKPSRIVYIQRFCDESGAPARHPGLPVFPEQMLTTILFTPEDENQTRVTVNVEPMGAVTAEETSAFINTRSGMTLGWSGSFDQLEAIITPVGNAL